MDESSPNIKRIVDLGADDSGCSDVRIRHERLELWLDYRIHDKGEKRECSIVFSRVLAFRFGDVYRGRLLAEESYDCIVEVSSSSWRIELALREPAGLHVSIAEAKHYAVFVSDYGYLEVLCIAGVSRIR